METEYLIARMERAILELNGGSPAEAREILIEALEIIALPKGHMARHLLGLDSPRSVKVRWNYAEHLADGEAENADH